MRSECRRNAIVVGRLGVLFFLGSLVAVGTSVSAAAQAAEPNSDSLVTLIDRFLRNPIAHSGLRSALVDSAEARSDVSITISAAIAPWLCHVQRGDDVDRAFKSLLLAAFVAGNMRAQLVSGVKEDQPQAGVTATLRVYEVIRSEAGTISDSTLDQWLVLEEAGALKAHIDSVLADPRTGCP